MYNWRRPAVVYRPYITALLRSSAGYAYSRVARKCQSGFMRGSRARARARTASRVRLGTDVRADFIFPEYPRRAGT